MTERQFPKRLTASLISTAIACASLGSPAFVLAQTVKQRNPAGVNQSQAPVTLNFVNAEIEGVARAVGAILNRQFIVDPRVKGSMTLYSDQPITPREVYLNFLTALRGLGFTVVDNAGVLKIVPEADAKLQAGTVSVGSSTARQGDVVMTQIFKLNYENVNNLVPVLRPLISPNNTINANPGNNTLVITDYADNLQRLSRIIASMDMPSSTDVEVIPLKYAIAADTAALVQKLADATPTNANTGGAAAPQGTGTTGTSSVLVDPRSNALVIRAPNPARLAVIRNVIAKLDVPGTGNAAGGIYVVYLKNADAVRLASVLRAAYAGSNTGNSSGSSAGGLSSLSGAGVGGTGGGGGLNQSGSNGGLTNTSSSGSSMSGGVGSQQSTQPVSPVGNVSTGGMVQADPATNSLIITAPEPLYRQMRVVIDQLDSRRAQVYIESMIVKMDASKAAQFGFQWQTASNGSGSRIYGAGTNFGSASSGTNILTLSAATAGGATTAASTIAANPPNGFNIGFLRNLGGFYTLGALANFLETNTDSNVLSTPNLVALDNEEAKIVIGQNVPFLTGQYSTATTTTGAVNPFQTFQRQDVGLTLRVRPQIGENGTIRMTIYQENSSVNTAQSTTSGLVTDKSSIETSVVVDDGQTLVLGGLLKDEYTNGVNKVPGLGDVPVVGNLFRNDNRSRTKTNLMVFLRPVIMKSAEDNNGISVSRYDAIRNIQQTQQPEKRILVPIDSSPVLPDVNSPGGMLPTTMPGYALPSQRPSPTITLTPSPEASQPPAGPQTLPVLPAVPAGTN